MSFLRQKLTEIWAETHTIRGSFPGRGCGVYSVFFSVGNGVVEVLVPVVKLPWSEAQYTVSAIGKTTNELSRTSTPQYAYRTRISTT